MNQIDRDKCLEAGAEPALLEPAETVVTLRISKLSGRVLGALADLRDLSLDTYLSQHIDSFAAAEFTASMVVKNAFDNYITGAQPKKQAKRLYFVRRGHDGPIKIGVSHTPSERVKDFRCGNAEPLTVLLEVEQAGDITERALHKRFAAHRKSGEWFEPCDELMALIARLSR